MGLGDCKGIPACGEPDAELGRGDRKIGVPIATARDERKSEHGVIRYDNRATQRKIHALDFALVFFALLWFLRTRLLVCLFG